MLNKEKIQSREMLIMAESKNSGVLIFEGMTVGFCPGDLTISIDEEGKPQSSAILSTSYNVLPLWLRVAHDNVALAKAAYETIADQWNDVPDNQRALLLAELTPAIQTFVACGIAYDAFYEQIKPFASISENDVAAWKKNRTSRATQISEVIRRVYKLNGESFRKVKNVIKDTIRLRDLAVHPSHKIERAINRPDIPVGLDWRFCTYRYENASICYKNIVDVLTYLRNQASPEEKANEIIENTFKALLQMGIVSDRPAPSHTPG